MPRHRGPGREIKVSFRKGGNGQIWVYGLDVATTDEEIVKTIGESSGIETGRARVLYKKETEAAETYVLVEIPKSKIDGIYSSFLYTRTNGWNKIEWMRCTVQEKIQVTRCYRCLGIGHMAPQSKEDADRSGRCLK